MSYPGGVHTVKNGRESTSYEGETIACQAQNASLTEWTISPQAGVEYPLVVKSFLTTPNLGLALGVFLSRIGNSMGEMSGEAPKYGGQAAAQPDVKRASACVSSRSAVGFVMISTAPSSRARWVSLVSA
jgi:hypothetical protein